MHKVILENIHIQNIDIHHFNLHSCMKYNVFFLSQNRYKIVYQGYVGENEVNCFYDFSVSMIIDSHHDELFIFKETYPYLIDILISIILILLDII